MGILGRFGLTAEETGNLLDDLDLQRASEEIVLLNLGDEILEDVGGVVVGVVGFAGVSEMCQPGYSV